MTENTEENTIENVEIQEVVQNNPMENLIRNITCTVLPIVEDAMGKSVPISSVKNKCDRCGAQISGEEPSELFILSGIKFVRYYLCKACADRAIRQ